jgi:hypothetical protein
MRGMYLDTADAVWKGAPDNEDAAEDILSLNNNN